MIIKFCPFGGDFSIYRTTQEMCIRYYYLDKLERQASAEDVGEENPKGPARLQSSSVTWGQ